MNLMELHNLHNLHEERKIHIENEDGSLVYGWKSDLEDEEDVGYIPKGYSKKVLELGGIFANDPGKGQGDRLMKLFLGTPEAKKAELIFLDRVPNLGTNHGSGKTEEQQMEMQRRFYERYGFRARSKNTGRMWLVRKGEIPDNRLPS